MIIRIWFHFTCWTWLNHHIKSSWMQSINRANSDVGLELFGKRMKFWNLSKFHHKIIIILFRVDICHFLLISLFNNLIRTYLVVMRMKNMIQKGEQSKVSVFIVNGGDYLGCIKYLIQSTRLLWDSPFQHALCSFNDILPQKTHFYFRRYI